MSTMKSGCFLLWMIMAMSAFAQPNAPKAGQKMFDFSLQDVENYSKSKISLNDFKGKWLVMDFWYRGCGASATSLPKMDSIHRAFKDKLSVLMVVTNSNLLFGKSVKPLFQKLIERQNLSMPAAYDSTLSQKWNIYSFPYIIIVNPQGIVHSVTTGYDLSIKKVTDMVAGKEVTFDPKRLDRPVFYADSIPNLQSRLKYRSILTSWDGEWQIIPGVENYLEAFPHNGIRFARTNLQWLYMTAYLGKSYWSIEDSLEYVSTYQIPVLEMKDQTPFKANFLTGESVYNYQLDVPPPARNAETIMRIMQNDLKNMFGYEAHIEYRDVPVWKLTANKNTEKLLKTKGASPYSANITDTGNNDGDGGLAGFFMVNYPLRALKDVLLKFVNKQNLPLIDETGINYNIDIRMDALMTDLNQINRELNKYGLTVTKAPRKMKVLVITDPDQKMKLKTSS